MTRCKINDEFRFPESIDMAPYTVEYLSSPNRPIDPDVFELVGVLVHSGTAESGHYYSYIRERPSSKATQDSWVQFNDSDVNVFDPARIHDCCFGGVDTNSPLQFSKAYNAYMLFYQRRASIQNFEVTYVQHDLANPVRLRFAPEREQYVSFVNELYIRSYCVQDRSHAKFVRLILERMRWGKDHRCSDQHETETKALRVVLEYVQQISCRFKDLPDFEPTLKLLTGYVNQCEFCATAVTKWYLADSNFRDTVLRNPQPIVRRAFGSLLVESLRALRYWQRERGVPPSNSAERVKRYKASLKKCVEVIEDQWDDIHKFARAWNDYFEVLSQIAHLGSWESSVLLDNSFLEKVLEIIWVDGRGDPKKVKRKYPHFVSLREKGRVFSHTGLLSLLAALLDHVDLNLSLHPDGEREESGKLLGLTPNELRMLAPSAAQQRSPQKFEWLRRIVTCRYNPIAVGQIVANLAQEQDTAICVVNTLSQGLAAEQVLDAVAYLDPTLVFCTRCTIDSLVLRIATEALDGIESINMHYGKEHLDFVVGLRRVENEALKWSQQQFSDLVLQRIGSWAPILLLYPDNNVHCDVAAETADLVNQCLLAPLESNDLELEEGERLRDYARRLVAGCIKYIRANYIPGRTETVCPLEAGQASQIDSVITHIAERYFSTDNAVDEQELEGIRETMASLRLRAQTAVETLSESWQDNDSLAISDSDNADLTELDTANLATP